MKQRSMADFLSIFPATNEQRKSLEETEHVKRDEQWFVNQKATIDASQSHVNRAAGGDNEPPEKTSINNNRACSFARLQKTRDKQLEVTRILRGS
ncbi:hypothetical protein GOP47_0000846 [Adiantum capillus-veneris]|uniref:Uncharacterized protein n=1 Tax=Adiantum capillus-veneris TaxID=13818 RepID=A0A9D4VEA1_ADICA|nr:hypothetical protein GOP47_0000846 [Adiantum capillus-veneris]